MKSDITGLLEAMPVVPLIQAEDPGTAVQLARALARGGLTVAEIVLRTDAALECLAAVVSEVPEMTAGAGTVLNATQAEKAIQAGARFVVAPGIDAETVCLCQSRSIPIYPGTATPTEVMTALRLGLFEVKFFPCSLAGGIPMLQAMASVFRGVRFMPTGGISASNLPDFLALPSVLACGGSWLTPASAIESGNWDEITRLAKEAVSIASQARYLGSD